MSDEDEAERVIARMKAATGVELDRDLATKLGVAPSAISAWRKRGRVPEKYRLQMTRIANEYEAETGPVGPSFYALRSGYIFALLGLAARQLPEQGWLLASADANEVWYGFRLYRLHAALVKTFHDEVTRTDKDSLRRLYEDLKRRIKEGDIVGWIESLPNP